MRNIEKKPNLIYSLGLAGAIFLGSCASPTRNYSTLPEAQKVLRVPLEEIEYLPGGYKTDLGIGARLRAIAGLYDRNAMFKISVFDGKETLMINGIFGSDETTEYLAKVADRNGDKIVDEGEINNLEKVVIDALKDK